MVANLLNIFQWLVIVGSVLSTDLERCINSNAKDGKCVPIDHCPVLWEMARKPLLSVREMQLLNANICGKGSVCCDEPVTLIESRKMAPADATDCGFGNVNVKIAGGSEAALDQYRWMVVIEHIKDGTRRVICGGALINTLYVLTAAHCFKDVKEPEHLVLRLGDHHLLQDPDCDASGNCNDPMVEANVSQIIRHQKYRRESNDIALLKLSEPIEYTNYIIPICLPVSPAQQEFFINQNVYAVGWGINEPGEQMSQVKLHVELKITEVEECVNLFRKIKPSEMHVCAKSATDKVADTCEGDSGGPLMIELEGKWFHVGVVNFGLPCGTMSPAIYARTAYYMDWIQENLLE